MNCLETCKKLNQPCKNTSCRMWNDYDSEFNCTLQTVEKNGALSLRDTADRLGISFVRVKQIEDGALDKLLSALMKQTGYSKERLKQVLFYQ